MKCIQAGHDGAGRMNFRKNVPITSTTVYTNEIIIIKQTTGDPKYLVSKFVVY